MMGKVPSGCKNRMEGSTRTKILEIRDLVPKVTRTTSQGVPRVTGTATCKSDDLLQLSKVQKLISVSSVHTKTVIDVGAPEVIRRITVHSLPLSLSLHFIR